MALQLFKIADTTVATPQSSITFSSIPSGYSDLLVKIVGRSSAASVGVAMNLYFNADSTAGNYSCTAVYGNGSNAASYATDVRFGAQTADSATALTFGSTDLYIPNYTSSNNKTYLSHSVTETSGTTAYIEIVGGRWTGTAAITAINISLASGNFMTNSTATLYGIL